MPRAAKKLLLSLLIALFTLGNFVTPLKAAGVWYNQGFDEWAAKVYSTAPEEEIFGERYTAAQVQWVVYGLFAMVISQADRSGTILCMLGQGATSICIGKATTYGPVFEYYANTRKEQRAKGGVQLIANAIISEKLISTSSYINDVRSHLNLVPEAKAQGFGFRALNPILTLWKASRDIAYSFFVIAIVITAFMIMFRLKISPQVVITVQSALPRIIIALILVTFSYAIAGLLIDLMYVVIGVLSLLGSRFVGGFLRLNDVGPIFNLLTLGQPFSINLNLGVLGLFLIYLPTLILGFALTIAHLIGPGAALAGVAAGTVVGVIAGLQGGGLGFLIMFLLLLLVIIILLWMFLKTVWTLLKAYVSIVLLTIFAPFQILIGIFIPNFGFGSWMKNYISQLAIFVVTGALFLLAYIFVFFGYRQAANNPDNADLAMAVLQPIYGVELVLESFETEKRWPPLMGTGTAEGTALLFFGASFVVFTMIPKSAKVVESLVKGQPFAYGSAAGEVLEPARWMWNLGPVRATRQEISEYSASRLLERLADIGEATGLGHDVWEHVRNVGKKTYRE